jgi:hypothetical protein
LGDLSTPNSVQKLQTALHAKSEAEPGYRFYALYDKFSRADILAYAYAQCRSNKGAPGLDRQDFEDVEAYGVERWAELALALRQETDRFQSDACTRGPILFAFLSPQTAWKRRNRENFRSARSFAKFR